MSALSRRRSVVIADSLFFLLLLIPLSRRNLRSLLLSGNRRYRIKTLTQLAEWSLFVVDYFIL